MARKQKKNRKQRHTSRKVHKARPATKSSQSVVKSYEELLADVRRNPSELAPKLDLVEYYARNQQPVKALALLEEISEDHAPVPQVMQSRVARLTAYCQAHLDNWADAEKLAVEAIESEPGSLDLLYSLAYARLRMKDYTGTIEAGTRYLLVVTQLKSSGQAVADITGTAQHVSQLLNMLASAYKSSEQFDEAAACYEEAINWDKGNHLPYINLAHLYHLKGNSDQAVEVLDRGLTQATQVQEIRMMRQSVADQATVSACMIVKNEEELLPGCLDSIRDWIDEIIIVDTGSTDRTIEIAKSYGAKIYHQEWEGNFSKHRNYSLDLATSDWVFIIDADERFVADDLPQVRPRFNDPRCQVLTIDVLNIYGDREEKTTFLPSVRFFRRELNLRYEGIVHNVLDVPTDITVHRLGARIKHLGYDLTPEKMQAKFERTSQLLEQQLQENPNNTFALFNYAQLLSGYRKDDPTRHADKIIGLASRAIELCDVDDRNQLHIYLMCHNQLAWTYFFIGEFEKALEVCDRAIKLKANYLDLLLLRGHIESKRKHQDQAIEFYRQYLQAQSEYDPSSEVDNIIMHHVDSRAQALFGIGAIAELLGEEANAKKLYAEAIAANPHMHEIAVRLGVLQTKHGDFNDAEITLARPVEAGRYIREAHMGLAYLKAQKGKLADAELLYRDVLSHEAGYPDAALRLADVLYQQQRFDEARLHLEALIISLTISIPSLEKGASLAFQHNDFHHATALYSAIPARDRTAAIWNDLGNCHYRLGDMASAVACYQSALTYKPVLLESYRNLGVAQSKTGSISEAIQAFESYLKHCPEDTATLYAVADLHSRNGQFAEALPWWEKLLSLRPNDTLAVFQLSECYLTLGHRDSAILGYQRALQLDGGFAPARDRLQELALSASGTTI